MSSSPPDAPASESLLAPETPYRGLTPYSEQDAPLFFGRDDACEIVIDNMMASRLTLLYGASGVGKTSLLRAGVTHELLASSRRNIAIYGSPEFVVVYFNQWTDDPVTALTRCIHESVATAMGGQAEEPEIPSAGLAETLHTWTTTLGSDLLIILDQFEEYFLYHPDDDGDGSFAVELPRAVNRADLRVSFLIAIREDALARLDRFKGRIPNLFDNYLRVRHLDAAAARAAIEKPLEAYNRLVSAEEPFMAEPELVQLVLDQVQIGKVVLGTAGRGMIEQSADQDVTSQRIETPYLQLVLTRLWQEEVAAGSHTLRVETLRRLGGAQRIVQTHLDEALRALPAHQQDVAAGVFHHLVTPSGTKIAHTAPDLADYAQLPRAEVESLLQELSRGDVRILRPVPPSGQPGDDPAYEIFHDVLAPAVLGWWTRHNEARAAEARLAVRLERSAADTRAAEEQARHYRQLLKRVSVVAMALLLVLMSAVAYLASRDLRVAVEARKSSRSRELAAAALAQIANPAVSLRLALEALQEDSTPEAASALRRAVSEPGYRVSYKGHGRWVMSASFSPDGRSVLTSSLDSTIRLWDTATGRQLARLETGRPPYHLAGRPQFSPDGDRVLVTTMDGRVQIWPTRARGQPTIVSSGQKAYRAAFSPSGDEVVTGHRDGTTRVWAWRMARPPAVLPRSSEEQITTVAFSPDGRFVAAGSDTGTVRLWRWRAPGPPVTLRGHQDWMNTLAFDPTGRYLLTASDDGTSRLFSVPDGRAVAMLPGNNDFVNTAAFSPDGKLAVTAGADRTARLFTVPGGRPVAVLRGHTEGVSEAVFSPDGRLLATASGDGTGAVWTVGTSRKLIDLRGHEGPVFTVAFAPGGQSLVTASGDGTARRWDVPAGRVFEGANGPLNAAVYSPDGRYVATGGEDGTSRLYEAATGEVVAVLDGKDEAVDSVAFSPDGTRMVTAGATADFEGVVRLWEVAEPNKGKVVLRDASEIISAEFSADGRLLVSTTENQTVIADARTGRARTKITVEKERETDPFIAILSGSLSPDGQLVATTHYENTARLWDAGTGKLLRRLQGHTGVVYTAAFSRDGRLVVTAGGDRSARVWDPQTGRQLHALVGSPSQLRSAAFSPDMRWVVGGAVDGSLWIWELATEQLTAVLHPHTARVLSVGFSPDNRFVLSASDDQTAKTSSCDSCRPLEELLAVARQRERLAAGSP